MLRFDENGRKTDFKYVFRCILEDYVNEDYKTSVQIYMAPP